MKQYEIYFILFLFLFPFPFIKGQNQCDGCNNKTPISCFSSGGFTCNANCRPKFSSGEISCYYCDFNGENFYEISGESCTPLEQCPDKIVYSSNECVSACDTNYYKIDGGDYCYYNPPDNPM